MPGACVVLGPAPDYMVLAATDDYLRLTGATRALVGQGLLGAVTGSPEAMAALRHSIERAGSGGDPQTFRARPYGLGPATTPPESDSAPWMWVTRAVPNEQGQACALVHHVEPCAVPMQAAGSDPATSDREPAVNSPLADLGPLEPMFGGAPIGIAILRGREHRIVYANAVELSLWGRTAEQVIGRTVAQGLPELVEQGLIQALCDPVLETGEPVVMTEQPMAFDRNGEGRTLAYFNAVHLPIRDAAGEVAGLLAIAWETTEAVVARRQVEELSRQLAARVDLEQHLIGIVSHDLRNPLNVIQLSAQVLARSALSAPQTELVERIDRVTQRATQLIRDLLDFTEARMGGRIPLKPRPVSLRSILRPVVEQIEVEHPGRVVVDASEEVVGTWDAARIGQAVQNLLANAVQYSDEGTPVVLSSGQGDGFAWICVHNHGNPIAPDLLDRIFDPMRRAHAAPNSATRSIGMGLYITERIAAAHGGHVTVTSGAAEGTRFTLWLPLSGLSH